MVSDTPVIEIGDLPDILLSRIALAVDTEDRCARTLITFTCG